MKKGNFISSGGNTVTMTGEEALRAAVHNVALGLTELVLDNVDVDLTQPEKLVITGKKTKTPPKGKS